MTLRVALLVALVLSAYAAIGIVERRGRRTVGAFPPGLFVVTGPHCRICGPALTAIRRHGIEPVVVDVGRAPPEWGPIRSLPVAVVGDGRRVVMRRSGRSVLEDAPRLAAAARAVGEGAVPPPS